MRLALLLVAATALLPGCGKKVEGPNILLITLDTTRRDHLGMYGYRIPTSPNLDLLAKDSLVYTHAYATSSWTMPTHASIFTGKFPSAHGAIYDPEGPLNLGEGIGKQYGGYRARPIAENETTLAQLLTAHGYATAGIIAGPWLLGRFRLGKGFQQWDDSGVTALNGRPAADVTRAAIEYVDGHARAPFFLFLNYYDAHSPWWEEPPRDAAGRQTGPARPLQDLGPVVPPNFNPSSATPADFARLCYDGEIHAMDAEIGRLIAHLREHGLYENTWIFVLADHGELIDDPILGDTGLSGHGDSLTEPEIHIPFFVKEPGPSGRKGEEATPVQQIDILPTVLARLAIALPPDIQGVRLGGKHPIVAELHKLPLQDTGAGKDWRHLGDWRVIVDGDHKYGWSSNQTPFLVDLAQDPGERKNLVKEAGQQALVERLDKALDTYVRFLPKPGETGQVEQPTPEELKVLKGLGYAGEGE